MAISNEPPRIHEQQSRPDPLPVASYVMSYETRQQSNQAAIFSLIFGLLFFIPLALPGIMAIVLGRRGMKVARQEAAGRIGMARAGIVLGVINLLLSLVFVVSAPFAITSARINAQRTQCMSNLRQIGMATMMYAVANRGFMPPTVDHIATMMPGIAGTRVFGCPACAGDPTKPPVTVGATVSSHYHYIPPALRLSQIKAPGVTVVAYEPPSNHNNKTMNLLFADGHVESITGPSMSKIAAELAAGQNPPPSKP